MLPFANFPNPTAFLPQLHRVIPDLVQKSKLYPILFSNLEPALRASGDVGVLEYDELRARFAVTVLGSVDYHRVFVVLIVLLHAEWALHGVL